MDKLKFTNDDTPGFHVQRAFKTAKCSIGIGAIVAAASIAVGCSGGTQSPLNPLTNGAHASGPKVRLKFVVQAPVSGGLYLGAQVNPQGTSGPGPLASETLALEQQVYGTQITPQQHFAFHLQYRDWKAMATIGTDVGILDDINNGRVPVISWNCADNIPATPISLTGINAGNADPDLNTIKAQLMMLKYPGTNNYYPIILRYFWEFNINATQNAPFGQGANNNGGCFTGPPGNNYSNYSLQFTSAWNHIHVQLGSAGIPNITWDWNPNITDTDSGYNNGLVPATDPASFYPGINTVDWIGVDGYSKLKPNLQPKTFSDVFYTWYTEFSGYGKPMMIGETGSCRYYGLTGGYSPDQVSYVQQLESFLGPSGSYSNIHALLYFDANGSYNPINKNNNCNWILDPNLEGSDSITGLQAFTNLASDSKFLNKVTPP